MKQGTLYAKKLKKAQSRFRGCGAQSALQVNDPIEHVIIAVLSQETSVQRAERAMRQLRTEMVDYNELRVSSPAEISAALQNHVPHPVQRAKALLALLNAIYRKQYAVSLDGLANRGVREIKSYLDGLDGITPYVSAYLLLWVLGGHAIPVNAPTLEALRRDGLVDPAADVAEVQAFLERHVSSADAQDFARDLAAYAGSGGRAASASAGSANNGGGRGAAQRKPGSATRRRTGKAAARTTAHPTSGTAERKSRKKSASRRKK